MVQEELVVEVLEAANEGHVAALAQLLPQLSSAPSPDLMALREIVGNPDTCLFVARLGDRIVGTLTLQTFRLLTGVRAWIEDVVVDEAARGRGAGSALVERAVAVARERGAVTVDLTSRPSREAANALYRRLGFSERETNVYRVSLEN
ncbi:MAG TPA: GNAT family N-acetyltransferase [Acidimicrobiales bacterium]|nr:GNAT family N-acetyltransferase [Acidimicrobiales bacterium]